MNIKHYLKHSDSQYMVVNSSFSLNHQWDIGWYLKNVFERKIDKYSCYQYGDLNSQATALKHIISLTLLVLTWKI